ncbi:MAG TPA: glycosyltransferase family 87 protein [Tepidisphaeraceae bacterium]|nr:glycosyltransferase family 87 protein [Tepidisphaeraceae bacterium]
MLRTVDNRCIGFTFSKLALLQPAPLRKRLWQGGGAMLVLILTFTIGNLFISQDKSVTPRMLGHDFLAFYSAGTFARQGKFELLYDLGAVREVEHSVGRRNELEMGKSFGPFWNPPFYAWIFAPLSALSYENALIIWTWLNLTCLAVAILMLIKMLPAIIARPPSASSLAKDQPPAPVQFIRDWRNWALVPLLICVSMPFVQAISHGQNTFMSLMLLTFVVAAWRKQMPIAAGLACGLLFYKPQLAAVVAAMLVLSLGARVCVGLGCAVGTLLLITARTMPDMLGNYLVQLPLNLKFMQIDQTYLWERHVTLKAFWRLLLQGRGPGDTALTVSILTIASVSLVVMGLVGAWWRTRKPGVDDVWTCETRAAARDRLIGATIVAMPLIMPFYFDYDLLLLAVPAVLLAGEIIALPPGAKLDSLHRMLLGAWTALFLWLIVNPPLAATSGVNVSVILLSTICSLSILRACRMGIRTSSLYVPTVHHVNVKRAA